MSDSLKYEWKTFCKLGEMIGDGLHHEEPSISKEYNKLRKILIPETPEEKKRKKEIRKIRNKNIDKVISERLKSDRCKCNGELKQTRSGSKTVRCTKCNNVIADIDIVLNITN